jgi:hypothetical protein
MFKFDLASNFEFGSGQGRCPSTFCDKGGGLGVLRRFGSSSSAADLASRRSRKKQPEVQEAGFWRYCTSVACDSSHSADPRVQIIFEYLVCIGLKPNRMVHVRL